jgi:selenocysteine-specific elongation factor
MIAGLGAIDLALLVVAADDGWMPQTEEHFQILNYLGIRHGVVAITKCDLGDPARIAADVREQLRGTSLSEMPIVETSARVTTGLDDLKQTLARVSAGIPPPRDCGKPRLFVDRVFAVRGTGTVVTGTDWWPALARKTISAQPQNLRARIRSIQSHNQSLEMAFPERAPRWIFPTCVPMKFPAAAC